MNKELEQFCNDYEAYAELSHKQYARRKPFSLTDYRMSAMEVYDMESFVEREPYVELTIPQHRLHELLIQHQQYRLLQQAHSYAEQTIKRESEDKLVRLNNPAVMKAYEKYQVLLEMSRK